MVLVGHNYGERRECPPHIAAIDVDENLSDFSLIGAIFSLT